MKLLYRTAEWHALAKLRMHTDSSLDLLEKLTTEFGQLMRQFRDLTCTEFTTMELPKEAAARARRTQQQVGHTGTAQPTEPAQQRRTKCLNLSTIKFHFLGDYVAWIRRMGTTDSYSTQLVCKLISHHTKTDLIYLK